MTTTVRVDMAEWRHAIALLRSSAPPAIVRALNRSAASGSVVMVRLVAQDLRLKQADVKSRITIRPASPNDLRVQLIASGARIPLVSFSARERSGRGVTAGLPSGRGVYPQAFIARMASGHRGVFMRKGRPRLPIVELFGPSIPHVFRKYVPETALRVLEQLTKNLVSEMRFALRRSAA